MLQIFLKISKSHKEFENITEHFGILNEVSEFFRKFYYGHLEGKNLRSILFIFVIRKQISDTSQFPHSVSGDLESRVISAKV